MIRGVWYHKVMNAEINLEVALVSEMGVFHVYCMKHLFISVPKRKACYVFKTCVHDFNPGKLVTLENKLYTSDECTYVAVERITLYCYEKLKTISVS